MTDFANYSDQEIAETFAALFAEAERRIETADLAPKVAHKVRRAINVSHAAIDAVQDELLDTGHLSARSGGSKS